jgi:rhamnulokinase
MWLLEQCRKEWEKDGTSYDYPTIVKMASSSVGFQSLVDPDHPSFANPKSMTAVLADYCRQTGQVVPTTHAALIRCIFDSLALKYKYVLGKLQHVAPFAIERLHIIGGGAKNQLLNQLPPMPSACPSWPGPLKQQPLATS